MLIYCDLNADLLWFKCWFNADRLQYFTSAALRRGIISLSRMIRQQFSDVTVRSLELWKMAIEIVSFPIENGDFA